MLAEQLRVACVLEFCPSNLDLEKMGIWVMDGKRGNIKKFPYWGLKDIGWKKSVGVHKKKCMKTSKTDS